MMNCRWFNVMIPKCSQVYVKTVILFHNQRSSYNDMQKEKKRCLYFLTLLSHQNRILQRPVDVNRFTNDRSILFSFEELRLKRSWKFAAVSLTFASCLLLFLRSRSNPVPIQVQFITYLELDTQWRSAVAGIFTYMPLIWFHIRATLL